jgi:hypothetical protein
MQPAQRRVVQLLAFAAGLALFALGWARSSVHSPAVSNVLTFPAAGACFAFASSLSARRAGADGLPRHPHFWGRVALLFLAVLALLAYGLWAMIAQSL